MIAAPAATPRDHANVVAFPPAVFLGAYLVGLLVHVNTGLRLSASRTLDAAGVALAVAGLALLGWAALTMRGARTAIYPGHPTTTIVTSGPFRFTRNPMYVGLTCLYIGVAISASAVWPLATLVPCLIIVRHGIVGREEKYLEAKFGEPYVAYMRRVRRWLVAAVTTGASLTSPGQDADGASGVHTCCARPETTSGSLDVMATRVAVTMRGSVPYHL